MNRKNVVCLGNIAFDMIENTQGRKNDLVFSANPGGSVFNTAILLSRLGLSTHIISKIGTDFLSDELLRIIQKENINTKYLLRDSSVNTALAFAKIDKKGDSSYVFYKSSGKKVSLHNLNVSSSFLKNTAVLHTGSLFSYADSTYNDTKSIMKKARKQGVFVTFDPNWRSHRIKDKPAIRKRISRLIVHSDLLKLSADDAVSITGKKTLASALRKIPAHSVVTMGAKGSFYWDGSKKIKQKAFKVNVIDTIGAGDAYTAGLIYRYVSLGQDLFYQHPKGNLNFAASLSALICQEEGATSGLKSLNQVKKFIKKFT